MNGAPEDTGITSNVQGPCPIGWHVPSDKEWKELEIEIGMTTSMAGATGFRSSTNEGHKLKSAKRLPTNLLDALRLLEKNKQLKAELGEEVIDSYVKLKMQEWRDYTSHLTEWERQSTLDC